MVDVVRVSCLFFVNVMYFLYFLERPTFTGGVNKLKIKTFCVLFLLKFTLVFFLVLVNFPINLYGDFLHLVQTQSHTNPLDISCVVDVLPQGLSPIIVSSTWLA